MFIDPAAAAQLKDQLTSDLSQLGRIYKAKNSPYLIKSVDHNLVDDMIREGWEEFAPALKTKTKLRRLKSHDVQFEDEVWCQLYRLGYKLLNFDRNFKLPYGKPPEDKQQIDVIAINDDTIILVECRSSRKTVKAPSYKNEFEGLKQKLHGFSKSLEQIFGKKRRVKYIFAVKNIRMGRDSADAIRLIDAGGFFYNENTYEYINQLIKFYKNAARYQFMALIFRGKLINKEKIEVPALEGTMGGETYYMFSLEPDFLLKMGFVLHRTRANEAEMPTYQRLLIPGRVKAIEKFIDEGGYFPNTVILNFSEKENKIEFQPSARHGASRSRSGVLKIPNAYAIAYIIDGQHRVYGYANTNYGSSNTIPVVAFCGLTSSKQLELFMEINENQKAVSPTLRITLEEDLLWGAERTDSRMKALRSSIIRKLGGEAAGPLYGKISLGEDKALLQAKPFATSLTKCSLLPQARGNKFIEGTTVASLYDTHNMSHDAAMSTCRDRVVSFINKCYSFSEEYFSDNQEIESAFILSNRGTFAFISLIGSLNTYLSEKSMVSNETETENRFDSIYKYLHALFEGISSLSNEDEKLLLGKLGTGADITWFRFFQNIVNQSFGDYEPADLLDWKERQDHELQDRGRSLGTQIERHLKITVIEVLQALFGENWDIEIGKIKRECQNRAGEQVEKNYKEGLGRNEIPWTDMFFVSDYKTIIEKYWGQRPKADDSEFQSFSDMLSIDVGMGFNSKSEKIKWLSIFNSYRNNWAHAGTREKGLNREEVQFLEKIYGKLGLPEDI